MTSSWLRQGARVLWQLPQTTLGALALVAAIATRRARALYVKDECVFVELEGDGAVSLGHFVFWSAHDGPYVPVGPENRDHEYGHALQSRWLGPLYLPLVGLPSLLRVAYAVAHRRLLGRRWGGYYDGYPENWADRLGKVDRSLRPKP